MQTLPDHPDYSQALDICRELQSKGYTAWLAGGCVRDDLLGRVPKDIDIVTSATPDQVQDLFPKTIAVGKEFGIIVVVLAEKRFDVATFRSDGAYVDGRRPTSVEFATPQQDAERRDFTINAMFLDPVSGALYDYQEGQQDLKKKIIRTVGDPVARFTEDKLRILRAIRFASELGFSIEPATYQAVQALANRIGQVSVERQWVELKKLIGGIHRGKAWLLLEDSGVFDQLFPELKSPQEVATERIRFAGKSDPGVKGWAFLASLFFLNERSAKILPGAADQRIQRLQECLRRFKASSEELEITRQILVGLEMISVPQRAAYLVKLSAKPFAEQLVAAARDLLGMGFAFPGLVSVVSHVGASLPAPLVTAKDLLGKGYSAGPRMGRVLEEAFNLQLENPQLSAAELLQRASSSSYNQ